MLYLAEVKKQRNFINAKTELKLWASQGVNQQWSAVSGEKIVLCDLNLNEGAILFVNVGTDQQIQGTPEIAPQRLVRELTKTSRDLEKLKSESEEIEQWRESLTEQTLEINRQKRDIEYQLEELRNSEKERELLQQQREEVERAKEALERDQNRYQHYKSLLLQEEQGTRIRHLSENLASVLNSLGGVKGQITTAFGSVEGQQESLNYLWQQLEQKKAELANREGDIEIQRQQLNRRRDEIKSNLASFEQAKSQLQIQQQILAIRQESFQEINLKLERIEEIIETIGRGMGDAADGSVDVESLEKMPLGELETLVVNHQKELEKLVRFVKDQEDELTGVMDYIKEIEDRLKNAGGVERTKLEKELSEEQEIQQSLDETLQGQRRRIRKQHDIVYKYKRILRRRQGVLDESVESVSFDIASVISQTEEYQVSLQQEKQKLEVEIKHLKQNIQQIQYMINDQGAAEEQKQKELEEEYEKWHQFQIDMGLLRASIDLYESTLRVSQDKLDEVRRNLQGLESSVDEVNNQREQYQKNGVELQDILSGLIDTLHQSSL